MSRSQLLMSLFVVVVLMWLVAFENVNSCFITNCPRGKRSFMPTAAFGRKDCSRCGPGLVGRCYGENICCSQLFGCSIGGPVAARCSLEAFNPVLCNNPGQACGAAEAKGVCALNSTCCTSGKFLVEFICNLSKSK